MPLPDAPIVVKFRDGEVSVPPHVYSNIVLSELDPETCTYEEAVRLSNEAITKRIVNDFQDRVVHRHFLDNR